MSRHVPVNTFRAGREKCAGGRPPGNMDAVEQSERNAGSEQQRPSVGSRLRLAYLRGCYIYIWQTFFIPKLLAISTFVRRKRNDNISLSVQ